MTHASGGFEVALAHLDEQILTGQQPDGSRLPAERELAAQLGVGRGAVREAIRVLQAQGILVSGAGPGNGTRVQAGHVDAIGRILRLHLAIESVSFGDVTETRVALERAAVEAAARRRWPEALAEAREAQQQMHRTDDPDIFNELDTRFHVALAEAGQNRLVSDLTVAIRHSVHGPIREAERAVADWPAFQAGLVAQHEAILTAVEQGDEQLAGKLVAEHIRHSYAQLLRP